MKKPLSKNLFPIEFPRNCLPEMEKRESYNWPEWPVSGSCSDRLNNRERRESRPAACAPLPDILSTTDDHLLRRNSKLDIKSI